MTNTWRPATAVALLLGLAALVVGLAAPAAAVKITVDNQTSAGWYFLVRSQKDHGCEEYAAAHSKQSCDALFGVSIKYAGVSRWSSSSGCKDCPQSTECNFHADPAVDGRYVDVTITSQGIRITSGGNWLKTCP
jgi:hypothetical protein